MKEIDTVSTPQSLTVTRAGTAIFIAATVIFWMSLYFYVPILSPYAEHLGAPLGLIGLIVGSYGFTQLVLRLPAGIWSDRLGSRRPFILSGFAFSIISALGLGLASSPMLLLAFRALSGAAATMWVAFTIMFSAYYNPSRATFAMGVMNSCASFGQLVATFAGGVLAGPFGWKAPFLASAAAGTLGLILMLPLTEVRSAPRATSAAARPRPALGLGDLLAVGRTPTLLIVSGLAVIIQYVTFVTVYGFTPVYADRLGATRAELGILSFVTILPNTIASLVTGAYLTQRFTRRGMLISGFLLSGASAAAVPFTSDLWSLGLTQAVGGWARGMVLTLLMGLSIEAVPVEKRATAMGFFQSIYSLGMFLGPALSGAIGDAFGLGTVFLVTGALGVLPGLLFWMQAAHELHGLLSGARALGR